MSKTDIQLKTIQRLETNILKVVVAACERHGLTYFISGGTYLGAVRHGGFIPWDDDIDIALPRRDYERLLRVLPSELPDYYELATYETKVDYNYLCAQVWDKRVSITLTEYDEPVEQPIWIDLFPLDGAPAPGPRRKAWKAKLDYFELMWGLARIKESSNSHQGRSALKQATINVGHALKTDRLLDSKAWCRRRERALASHDFYESDYCINAVGAYKFKSIFSIKDVYGDGADYDFGGLKLNGPADYDAYLTQIYGDYMELPPEDKRNWHGTEIRPKSDYVIGYTQGTFDMFHVGHLNLIKNAKAYCDYLIVGVNADELVHSYKNKTPVITAEDRAEILRSVKEVDECIVVDTLDKVETAKRIPFEAIFIGDDWKGNDRWERTRTDLGALGIDVVFLPHTDGVSSTMLRPMAPDRVEG